MHDNPMIYATCLKYLFFFTGTARIIRHAVGIDERRAKFRQDLVEKVDAAEIKRRRSFRHPHQEKAKNKVKANKRSSSKNGQNSSNKSPTTTNDVYHEPYTAPVHDRRRYSASNLSVASTQDGESMLSLNIHIENDNESDDDELDEQDIEEVWFPGAHGDIGGGWDLPSDEEPLSHGPLVWMVRLDF